MAVMRDFNQHVTYEYLDKHKEELINLSPKAPFRMDRPAPSEVVQRAAYAIHSATADILKAVNEVNDFQTAMELWQVVEQATVALMSVSMVAAARPELISKEKH